MKIAFINIYQNKVARGAETFVYELSKRLSKNHEVKIYTSLSVKDLLQKKYDVVIPVNGRWQAVVVRLATWLYGGKVIISGQSGIGFDDRLNLYTLPNVFVSLTDFQTNWAKRINPIVKIVKIPNGVSFGKEPEHKMQFDLPKPVILSVGALEKNKRHDLTIKAAAKIENTSLLIVGKGSEEKNLHDLAEKYLAGRFIITSLPYNEMHNIYKCGDVFVFPTVPWESFGIVLVEAMKSGLPVVSTDDPIRREIIGEAGILVDPTNADTYAEAIKKVLKEKWAEKATRQAKKYDWDIIADQYERLLAGLKE